ncbi:endonuclease/exonuclease/phosphatase family protein [Pseudidiomarina taiwanensis]|nr:endonuclease/exonuclease/phosphatase family protein [Pseudidiomarina taiwanensis]
MMQKIWIGVLAAVSLLLQGCEPMKTDESPVRALRVATFNVSMDASNYLPRGQVASEGATALAQALAEQHPQIKAIAEIIQHTRPDVLVLNEFDYIPLQQGLSVFLKEYLAVSQNGESPIDYPYHYLAPVNTGKPSPYDLNRDGETTGYGNDAWGFGWYEGQYAMVVLSRYPITNERVRTFQTFKWKDMPGALRPMLTEVLQPWYEDAAWAEFPLSSKSHWDVPINVDGLEFHLLVSHPTPPVFDGPEDRNGRRNHDEIRFWADYIEPMRADYIYDDRGNFGGLAEHSRFVIAGDLNASSEGDGNIPGTIEQLLEHPLVNPIEPRSRGGQEHTPDNPYAASHTASWRKRADYVLPSKFGIRVIDSGVFWPTTSEPKARLVSDRGASSDHRLVWADLQLY